MDLSKLAENKGVNVRALYDILLDKTIIKMGEFGYEIGPKALSTMATTTYIRMDGSKGSAVTIDEKEGEKMIETFKNYDIFNKPPKNLDMIEKEKRERKRLEEEKKKEPELIGLPKDLDYVKLSKLSDYFKIDRDEFMNFLKECGFIKKTDQGTEIGEREFPGLKTEMTDFVSDGDSIKGRTVVIDRNYATELVTMFQSRQFMRPFAIEEIKPIAKNLEEQVHQLEERIKKLEKIIEQLVRER